MALALSLVGCQARSAPPPAGEAAREADSVTDAQYLTAPVWDDGQAEVTFYEVERTRNQYDQPAEQRFMVGTYLVKHRFSPQEMTKAAGDAEGTVSAFKSALFYEFEGGSYQYKRHYVVNAAQADLQPLKASFTSFDWCSNQYRELAFQPQGDVALLMRSDDYGNEAGRFAYEAGAYPVALLPLLVRGLDFSKAKARAFRVVLPDGSRLVRLKPSDYHRRKAGEHLMLRLIEYTIDGEAKPGHGQRHRLLTTLDALMRKVGLQALPLRGSEGKTPLGGRMAALLDVAGSRQPRRVWYEPDSQAHDQRFWERALEALDPGALLLFDLGFVNHGFFALLTERQVSFITRLKKNAVWRARESGAKADVRESGVRDQIITLGSARYTCTCPLRLVEVPYQGRSYQYVTNVLDRRFCLPPTWRRSTARAGASRTPSTQ